MKMIRYCTAILFLLSVSFTSFTQTRLVDSLLQLVYAAKGDKQKLEATLNLCNE